MRNGERNSPTRRTDMQAHILSIVDPSLAEPLTAALRGEGMKVTTCTTADAGLMKLVESTFNLVILDYHVHGSSSLDLLRGVCSATSAPVMVVSESMGEEDMVRGLDAGAACFITKPFSPRVMAAGARALLRCVDGQQEDSSCILFGEYSLDIEAGLLKLRGRRVPLSPREFEVLAYLATHPNQAMSPDLIHSDVLKSPHCDISAVSVYVQRLRKKIEKDHSSPEYIKTVHGSGYKFIMETNGRPLPVN